MQPCCRLLAAPLVHSCAAVLYLSSGSLMPHVMLLHMLPYPQVGTVGEEQAADYLYSQVQRIAEQAAATRPDLTAEAARESVRAACSCWVARVACRFCCVAMWGVAASCWPGRGPGHLLRCSQKRCYPQLPYHQHQTLPHVPASPGACRCLAASLVWPENSLASARGASLLELSFHSRMCRCLAASRCMPSSLRSQTCTTTSPTL